jgi:hypothetical protein
VLDRRLQVRLLPREQRSVRRELLADGVEKRPEVAELVVLMQVERDAELPFAEPRQPAADHVDGPEEQLREERRDDDRDQERGERDVDGRTERRVELLPHQHRGYADADRSECLVAERHLLPHFERAAVLRIDDAQLVERAGVDKRRHVRARRQRLPFLRWIARRADDPLRVEDRGAGDALAVDARLEDGAQPGIAPQRDVRIVAGRDDDLARAMEDGVGEELAASLAFAQDDTGEACDVHGAQHDHGEADDGRDRGDLFGFDP